MTKLWPLPPPSPTGATEANGLVPPHGKRVYLKTAPAEYAAVRDGIKRFDVRSTVDRMFAVGDVLVLREWTPEEHYSGEWVAARVTYILRGPAFNIPAGHVVMSLDDVFVPGLVK